MMIRQTTKTTLHQCSLEEGDDSWGPEIQSYLIQMICLNPSYQNPIQDPVAVEIDRPDCDSEQRSLHDGD